MIDYYDIHKNMHNNSISLTFKGGIDFNLVDNLLEILMTRLQTIEDNKATRKKVYAVLVECLQNICHYIPAELNTDHDNDYDADTALFKIDSDEHGYTIATGNFIYNQDVNELKGWLDKVNNSSSEELRQLYREILGNKLYGDKGGAGLGFLDMARKSNNEIKYNFRQVDSFCTFFSFEIYIRKKTYYGAVAY